MKTNKKTLVLCGDSFNYGIGCVNLHTQPYGVLTANHFDWDLIRLARGSASNYVIHLQGIYAAKMNPKPHLVILGTTSTDRVEWLATGESLKPGHVPKFEDVNYHLYPPHHEPPPLHDAPMDFYLKESKSYTPKILSEQVVAFSDYLNLVKNGKHSQYYKRLHSESADKLELINEYYLEIFDSAIKRDYDTGVIMTAYLRLKHAGINTIIVGPDMGFSELVFEPRDFFNQDWGRCTRLWPDSVGSMHTGEGGHADTADRLIKHIEDHGFVV
jgi:hypothetical protein